MPYQILTQGTTTVGEIPKMETERALWSFVFRLREAVNAMPGGMTQPELVEYFSALFKDLRETMEMTAQLKSRKEPRARILILVARFNNLFNGERLAVMSVSDIYEAAEALVEMPKANEGHLFAGDLQCVWDQRDLYWADIVHRINQVRANKGEDKLVLDTEMHSFRLPGVSEDPRYRSPEPQKVRRDKRRREITSDPASESEMPPTGPKSKFRKKFKSASVFNNDSDEPQPTTSNKGKQRARDDVSDTQNTISLEFLEKIPRLPLLCVLQQAVST
ncbi:hypothetical protein K474DRAFT_1712299 [Panus rudis PR-1116 ss-1]|nr:hypothetical protein K474DRAFT_1712299 [Panus rudis PR-1116 ss-1]